jgi:hypothetical protein
VPSIPERMANEPPAAATRSSSPCNPEPGDIVAPPRPSSAISTRAEPLRRSTATVAAEASAC